MATHYTVFSSSPSRLHSLRSSTSPAMISSSLVWNMATTASQKPSHASTLLLLLVHRRPSSVYRTPMQPTIKSAVDIFRRRDNQRTGLGLVTTRLALAMVGGSCSDDEMWKTKGWKVVSSFFGFFTLVWV
ncbi:hypothetical protein L6452_03708 [Arctium lappa]|uniref:Uncharacterized protein n=1 Tax=Arctium lappa TaxID=4217 RepID=A0ACB9FN57_ARCLA|nr:hypothetical protein L6452_03708 [Arctium lappa]